MLDTDVGCYEQVVNKKYRSFVVLICVCMRDCVHMSINGTDICMILIAFGLVVLE